MHVIILVLSDKSPANPYNPKLPAPLVFLRRVDALRPRYPVISGAQMAICAWLQPFENSQAQRLAREEGYGVAV